MSYIIFDPISCGGNRLSLVNLKNIKELIDEI